MKIKVVIEYDGDGYCAYVPKVPECFAIADSLGSVTTLVQEALHDKMEQDTELYGIIHPMQYECVFNGKSALRGAYS